MIWVELAIVLLFIFIGARIGGIGIGLAGGAGVIALSLILGVPTKQAFIPVDVILIIMSVITAIAAMQVAGGMDWLVQLAENFLRKHPERITFYAPIVTFLMTLMAGTGHTAFSTLPVIAEVAKGKACVLHVHSRLLLLPHKSRSPLHRFQRPSLPLPRCWCRLVWIT